MSCLVLLLLASVLQVNWLPIHATTYGIKSAYEGTSCDGVPYAVYAVQYGNCNTTSCYQSENQPGESYSISCSSDYMQAMRDAFGSSQYIIQKVYSDECGTFEYAFGFLVTNSCTGGYLTSPAFYDCNLFDNGSASLTFFDVTGSSSSTSSSSFSSSSTSSSSSTIEGDSSCSSNNAMEILADKDELQDHSCLTVSAAAASLFYESFDNTVIDNIHYQWYSSNDSDDSGLSTGAIIGIVCGCVVAVLLIGLAIFFYRRRVKGKYGKGLTTTLGTGSLEAGLSGQVGLWNDDVITAKRIPRDKVNIKKLISRGAFGEVYTGTYNRQHVAIKVLLPANRSSIQHVNDFLAEAKLTASMDHPHIVSFVGVAWDSLSDLCVVLEFMDNGDLRTLLDKYESSKHPVGIDHQKATIALHVCHALTYLHSLLPAVIHRDLKSRNILLNHDMQAKLTDFGISRERMDQTMTAGVGTSLWMAPEVMLGERYDVKADMFSFGVVLSELDTHSLPYAQAKKRSVDTDGRQLTDAALLQKITSGTLCVDFSSSSTESVIELGRACVSIDPNDRPTAAEAAYRLQVILSKEL